MDTRLLKHYERELAFMRDMGAEFAEAYPKIASRLGMDGLAASASFCLQAAREADRRAQERAMVEAIRDEEMVEMGRRYAREQDLTELSLRIEKERGE